MQPLQDRLQRCRSVLRYGSRDVELLEGLKGGAALLTANVLPGKKEKGERKKGKLGPLLHGLQYCRDLSLIPYRKELQDLCDVIRGWRYAVPREKLSAKRSRKCLLCQG